MAHCHCGRFYRTEPELPCAAHRDPAGRGGRFRRGSQSSVTFLSPGHCEEIPGNQILVVFCFSEKLVSYLLKKKRRGSIPAGVCKHRFRARGQVRGEFLSECRAPRSAGTSLPSCGTSQQNPGPVQVPGARPRGQGTVAACWISGPWHLRVTLSAHEECQGETN